MWLGQNKFISSGPFSAILLGMVLGLLLEKSKVFDPEIVQKQMLFENFVMLKFFLSTLATGMFLCSIASMLQGHGGAVENTLIYYSANLIDQSYLCGILGGMFMGAGVACAGACPVSMFVQLGSGVPHALYVFLGAYCGTVLYDVIPPLAAKSKTSRQTYLHYSMSTPYFNVAMPLAVILATVTFFLELDKSWRNEYLVRFGVGSWLFTPVWSPYLIGISTAILQLILIGCFNKVITNSEVFTVINKTLMSIFKKGKLPSKSSKISTEYFWIFFSLGVILGAYFSSFHSYNYEYSRVTRNQAFVGGVLVSWGSKMAAGCYIGHGISGVMLLSKLSFAVVPALWAGGFIATSLLQYF
ncbi:Hypothetical predicted protein [Octopus vulgaris]|uniref:Uncharacterized protein n=2 Tax=Octopus vulgaris TaxID=6645 RepID=A0AA36ARF7_OCTVU|nr:Hypothetical predicted protein [Octopus vulgaris]